MDKKESLYSMANSTQKGRNALPEFQKYLLDRKLVSENKTKFYAYMVK